MFPYQDPKHEGNHPRHKSGLPCIGIESECKNLAGTAWSPYWCFECNVKRMDRISKQMEDMLKNWDENAL